MLIIEKKGRYNIFYLFIMIIYIFFVILLKKGTFIDVTDDDI